MPSIDELFAQAKAHHQSGQLRLAEPLYRQVVQADPAKGEAWYLLGAVCQALGKLNDALACLQQAVRLAPGFAEAHNHLGAVLAQQGKLGEAIVCFEQALRLRPNFTDADVNLGKAIRGATVISGPPTPRSVDRGLVSARDPSSIFRSLAKPAAQGNRRQKCLLVTAADARFFDLVQGCIQSVRDKPEGQDIDVALFDLGCTQPQREWLQSRVNFLREPAWEFDFPGREAVLAHNKGLLVRPFLKRYFPGYEVYLWLDADAWVQDWRAMELLLEGAQQRGLAIVPEIDRGSNQQYGGLPRFWSLVQGYYAAAFGQGIAKHLYSFPMLCAGVYALHRDAPHWQAWQQALGQALQKGWTPMPDQIALNLIVYARGLFRHTEILPAWCNWTCHYGLPHWDETRGCLVEPYLPHTPIGILHLTEQKYEQHRLYTTAGNEMEIRLRYPARPVSQPQPAVGAPSDGAATLAIGSVEHRSSRPAASYAYLSPEQVHSVQACNEQGGLLLQQGRPAEAAASFQQALRLQPDFIEAQSNLGVALAQQGKLEESLDCFRRAVQIRPDYADAWRNLGVLLTQQGNLVEAVASFQELLRLKPDDAESYVNLARPVRYQGKLEEAASYYRRALELKPDHANALNSLGTVLSEQGKQQEALACFRRAVELMPDAVVVHSNYVYCEQHRLDATLAELAAIHAQWDRRHGVPLKAAWRPHPNVRDPRRRLRLGFVSGDFRRHALAYIFVSAFEALDRQECETICYSNERAQDDMTGRFKAAADLWREAYELSDEALAQQIRDDGVDILFDLDGHTGGNRLSVFARKPAPVQITWLGSACTTGLSAMDYIIADRWEVPEGAERHYREQVLRLPDGYYCYAPPEYAPEPGPLPARERQYVTFGCFNKPEKINPSVVATWAAILHRIPTARLLLKYRGFADPGTCRYFTEMFAAQGVPTERLELQGYSTHQELLHQYNRVDIALDPFMFSGCVTTCEALWMGVPVITFPGETFAARHSLSHLSNVGLTETIADDRSRYVELAVQLAHDLPRLAKWRAELRPQMAHSPLCDAPRFAENLMQALRGVWQQWCEGRSADE